jgi:hypothetical protein
MELLSNAPGALPLSRLSPKTSREDTLTDVSSQGDDEDVQDAVGPPDQRPLLQLLEPQEVRQRACVHRFRVRVNVVCVGSGLSGLWSCESACLKGFYAHV